MSKIVITVGYPGCGKTTYVQKYIDRGFSRINRDSMGHKAKMKDVYSKLHSQILKKQLKGGFDKNWILDNTFATIESRKPIVDLGKRFGIPVICLNFEAKLENAQFLACRRMIKRFGNLLGPDEIKKKKKDPNTFPPIAQYGYRKRFEEPTTDEGLNSVIPIPFELQLGKSYKNSAIIFDYDGTLRRTKSGDFYPTNPKDIALLPNRKKVMQALAKSGALILGVSNQSGVAKGTLSAKDAHDCFKKTNKLLGVDIEYVFCPHRSNPISCFCRKPSPGWGVHFVEKYKLDPNKVTFVGDLTSDKTFAARSGFKFVHADAYFKV